MQPSTHFPRHAQPLPPRKAERRRLDDARKVENANAAAARMVARKKARAGSLPRPTNDLSPARALALYGQATREPLPIGRPAPPVGSPGEVNSRLLCLYRELNTIQRAIDEAHAQPTPTR